MKKHYFLSMMLLILIFCVGALNKPEVMTARSPLATIQQCYRQIASVTADATDLTVTTANWDDCKVSFIPIPAQWNSVELSFYGYDASSSPNATSVSYSVYCCKLYGGAEIITTGTFVITSTDQQMSVDPAEGTQLNSGAPSADYVWSDTITEVTKTWCGSISYSNNVNSGSVASLMFDRQSFYGIYVVMTGVTGESLTSVTCVMNGF